jgi:hypothetical protein
MTIGIVIEDAHGTDAKAKVLSNGQVVTGPYAFSTASTQTMDVAATSYTFWPPESGKRFVVTDVLVYANRNVGVNDATVEIYESTDGPATGTVSKELLTFEIASKTGRDLVGLNLIITEGSWINAETDDDDVFLTIMGYYVVSETQ